MVGSIYFFGSVNSLLVHDKRWGHLISPPNNSYWVPLGDVDGNRVFWLPLPLSLSHIFWVLQNQAMWHMGEWTCPIGGVWEPLNSLIFASLAKGEAFKGHEKEKHKLHWDKKTATPCMWVNVATHIDFFTPS